MPKPLRHRVPRAFCKHCRWRRGCRARGLCAACHSVPAIREQYPVSANPRAYRSRPDFNGAGAVPIPTDALPGSPEKVQVLMDRAARGERLWHDQDAVRP